MCFSILNFKKFYFTPMELNFYFRISVNIYLLLPFVNRQYANDTYDLMFITNTNCSMKKSLSDLKKLIPQVVDLAHLTHFVNRISVLAYSDYNVETVPIEWSGWKDIHEADSLASFVQNLKLYSNDSYSRAVKTGLLHACDKVKRPTICIMYTDAPPYHKSTGGNYEKEVTAIGEENSQWLNICQRLKSRKIHVYPMFYNMANYGNPFFVTLAQITGGVCLDIDRLQMVKTSVGLLLNLCGFEFDHEDSTKIMKMSEDFEPSKFLANDSEKYVKDAEYFPMKIECIEKLKMRVSEPVYQFTISEKYQKHVFLIFERIMKPKRVIALAYNTLFRDLWRSICDKRDDPRYARLEAMLTIAISSFSKKHIEPLKSCLRETYDRTTEIKNILKKYSDKEPFYIIDSKKYLSRKNIYKIEFSCSKKTLSPIKMRLEKLYISDEKPDKADELAYIPVCIEPALLFRILPHLMCPGTIFTMRLGVIVAIVAYNNNSIIKNKAVEYLNACRGKWIDFTLFDKNTLPIAKMLLSVAEKALTKHEIKYLRTFIENESTKKSKNRKSNVHYSEFTTLMLDYKVKCKTCGNFWSFTLLIDDSCVICEYYIKESNLEIDKERSRMAECRVCSVMHAVNSYQDLQVEPECNFCRSRLVAPCVECVECGKRFLCLMLKRYETFVCPICNGNESKNHLI